MVTHATCARRHEPQLRLINLDVVENTPVPGGPATEAVQQPLVDCGTRGYGGLRHRDQRSPGVHGQIEGFRHAQRWTQAVNAAREVQSLTDGSGASKGTSGGVGLEETPGVRDAL